MALDSSGYLSQLVQLDVLPISWMMRLDSSLNLMEFLVFPDLPEIDFVHEPTLNFPTTSWIFPFRSKIVFQEYIIVLFLRF